MSAKRDRFVEAVLRRTRLPSEVAAAERRRIRRLIAPHLLTVLSAVGHLTVANNRDAANRLMAAWANLKAATKAPRKARKGK